MTQGPAYGICTDTFLLAWYDIREALEDIQCLFPNVQI